MIGNQLTKWLSHVVAWLTYSISIYVNYDSEETGLSRLFPVMAAIGGFQLLDLIIKELKSHMTCQKFKVSLVEILFVKKKSFTRFALQSECCYFNQ